MSDEQRAILHVDQKPTVADTFGPAATNAKQVRISARAESDDGSVLIEFDAVPWFAQASIKQLRSIMNVYDGGSRWAMLDMLLTFSAIHEPKLMQLFDPKRRPAGPCTCIISTAQALAWLRDERPEVAKELESAQ